MGRRVWDAGRSEGHPVMGWIRVEPAQHHSTRKRADFPCGSCNTRDLGQPPKGRKQRTAVATRTGTLSGRLTVRRLQARMVKVGPQPGVRRGTIAFRKERWQGLSGM